jgi:hypothetical protein
MIKIKTVHLSAVSTKSEFEMEVKSLAIFFVCSSPFLNNYRTSIYRTLKNKRTVFSFFIILQR